MDDNRNAGSSGRDSSKSDTGDVYRVGIRNIPFYPDKPSLWFSMLEGQFVLANITTDSTKFYHVIGMLDHQYAVEVADVIESPPENDKYEKLKSELIKRLSASKERKVKQLLDHEELGDRKPSQFLRHLQHLAGSGIPEDFIRTIWTSRLPSSMQTIIASQLQLPLDNLADLADRIHDIAPPSPHVASASTSYLASSSHQNQSEDKIDQMSKQIEKLTKQVYALTMRNNRSRSPFRRNHRYQNRSRSRSQSSYRKYPVCWYHAKHGSKASKCQKPCDYKAEN